MANGFQSNETFNQIKHKKLTSLIKMTNVLQSNGTSYAYYIFTSYFPLIILQPTYLPTLLPTHPPTYLDVIPTYYQPTHLPTYLPIHPLITYLHINLTRLPTHPPTYLDVLPTYLFTHYVPTYPPTYLPHNLVVKCQNKHVKLENYQS